MDSREVLALDFIKHQAIDEYILKNTLDVVTCFLNRNCLDPVNHINCATARIANLVQPAACPARAAWQRAACATSSWAP